MGVPHLSLRGNEHGALRGKHVPAPSRHSLGRARHCRKDGDKELGPGRHWQCHCWLDLCCCKLLLCLRKPRQELSPHPRRVYRLKPAFFPRSEMAVICPVPSRQCSRVTAEGPHFSPSLGFQTRLLVQVTVLASHR